MRMIRILAVVIFLSTLGLGLWKASVKPLWNDESYSLVTSTLRTSYGAMLKGSIPEGNNTPLFYLIQKIQCDLFSYHPPQSWSIGQWEDKDTFSQVFLRIQPVLCSALALTFLFYFFATFYSIPAGAYALLVGLSSFMFWDHWIEARPYALWFMLSTIQMLLLINLLKIKDSYEKKTWQYLVLVHGLLALTATISMVQIAAASIIVWIGGYRRWCSYLWLLVIPVGISLFYYFTAPKYGFFFIDGPMALINANIPKDRIFIFLIFILFFMFKNWRKKSLISQVEGRFFLFICCMFLFFAVIFLKLKMSEARGHACFQISNRYFISLTPLGIIGTILFSVYLFRNASSRVGKAIILLLLTGLLLFRIQKAADITPSKVASALSFSKA